MLLSLTKKKVNLIFYSTSIKYYSTYPTHSTIPLSYTKYPFNKNSNEPSLNSPVIICHGLFGSKQNWKALGKAMSQRLKRDIYTLDLRNHGESLHALPHTYEIMADDVKKWIDDKSIDKPILLGHSMGGKTVMTFAKLYPNKLSQLIVEDIAPTHMTLLSEFPNYVKGMQHIIQAQVTTQKEADQIMQQYEPDLQIRQFLLTNLTKNMEKKGIYEFRVPVDLLGKAIPDLGTFLNDHQQYHGPTLFITGGKSPYRKPFLTHPEFIKQQFPHSTIEVIPGCGHWLHSEKPDVFLKMIQDFILLNESQQS